MVSGKSSSILGHGRVVSSQGLVWSRPVGVSSFSSTSTASEEVKEDGQSKDSESSEYHNIIKNEEKTMGIINTLFVFFNLKNS